MFLLSAALLLGMQTIPDMTMVEVKEGPKGCEYRAEGRRMTQQQLEHRAKTWARQGRRIEVHGNRDISYRCVGGVMDLVQKAGVEKVSFIGRPIRANTVLLVVPAGPCKVEINGEAVTMEALRTQAARWARDKPEFHFQPDPGADYQCVDAVLTVLKENKVGKLGFVGNEQNVAQ
jgi:biopolymer transport protein ExbD